MFNLSNNNNSVAMMMMMMMLINSCNDGGSVHSESQIFGLQLQRALKQRHQKYSIVTSAAI